MYKNALIVAGLCLVAALLFFLPGNTLVAGPLLVLFFIALAIGFRGYAALKGFAYTTTIFAAVTSALLYPHFFIEWNGFKLATLKILQGWLKCPKAYLLVCLVTS